MGQPDRTSREAGFIELEPLVIVGVDLIYVVIASMCLLLVGAGWVIGWFLSEVLGGISILGVHPFGAIGGLIQGAMSNIARGLISRVVALGHALWSLVMVIWRFAYVTVETVKGLALQILGVHQESQSGLAAQKAYTDSQIKALVAYTEGLFTVENQKIADDLTFAQTYTDLRIANLQALENSQLAEAQARESVDVANLQNNINRETNARIAQVGQAQTDLQNNINHVSDLTNDRITQVQDNLQANINTSLATAENFATGLLSGFSLGAIPQTLTALQAQVNNIATDQAECLDPLCDTVTPNAKRLGHLGDLLKGLESLGIEALLIALAAEALHDPGTVADDIHTVISDVGEGFMTAYKDLIGL